MKSILVVGAGLSGLVTAILLARGGRRVVVRERSSSVGGRARSTVHAGAILNLGPHAFYRKGSAAVVFRALGIDVSGAAPPLAGVAIRGGELHELPLAPLAMLRSSALSLGEKLSTLPYFSPLGTAPDVTVSEWLGSAPEGTRAFIEAAIRVSTYVNAPGFFSARTAQAQLSLAQGGVLYLHGGWQALVEATLAAARVAKVEVQVGAEVQPGEFQSAAKDFDEVVFAGSPAAARSLGLTVPPTVGVHAACLDLVLDDLPHPERRFALGFDEPYYLGEHGGVCALGGTVLHVAKYLAPGETGVEVDLERILDLVQPGWRSRVQARRFLPSLLVSGRVDEVGQRVPHAADGTWLVGDWVGERGLLLDRAMASAQSVAAAILAGKSARGSVPPLALDSGAA